MKRSTAIAMQAALATGALAQQAMFMPNITFSSVTAGTTQAIGYTPGNGNEIDLFLGNSTENFPIVENLAATASPYQWTVCLPAGWVPGNYALALLQSSPQPAPAFSPLFSVIVPAGAPACGASTTPTSSVPSITMSMPSSTSSMPAMNATMDPLITGGPMVTVTVYDPDCTCHKTTTIPSSICSTATNAAGTQYQWYDENCGCTKSALVPAPTPAPAANNYTAPPAGNTPVSPASPVTPALPHQSGNSAGRIGASMALGFGLAAAVFFL